MTLILCLKYHLKCDIKAPVLAVDNQVALLLPFAIPPWALLDDLIWPADYSQAQWLLFLMLPITFNNYLLKTFGK